MIIKIKKDADATNVDRLKKHLESKGFDLEVSQGVSHQVIGVIGNTLSYDINSLYGFDCVEEVIRIQEPFKEVTSSEKLVKVGDVVFGGNTIPIIAGPCAIESKEQVMEIAKTLKKMGVKLLRGGAYKARTSPYSFQGLGKEALSILKEVKDETGLLIVCEITSTSQIKDFENVDLIQVGARNMQNFELLKELGKLDKPILLKRGFANTVEEWIMSAEYIITAGNPNVIMCERGIRTFETYSRNTLDIAGIIAIQKLTSLPVIADPSHAAGRWDLVNGLALGSVAAGADGLLIEVHSTPEKALSDGAQSLKIERFKSLYKSLKAVAVSVGRKI